MNAISQDLIDKASRGDIKAFEEIYKGTSGFVYNVALRVARSTTSADDITQDVFMKVYKNLSKFNYRSSLKTWIYRITVNTAINYQKAEAKHTDRRADYDTVIQSAHAEERVRDNVTKGDEKERLSLFLETLTPEQRACIVLKEIEGLKYREIADALKINVNTVRSRLKRARRNLLVFAGKR
ncbi:RNA polymerase sigma factor [Candidatus Omnitrophota bacterium]